MYNTETHLTRDGCRATASRGEHSDTLPTGFAGGFDADLDKHILGGTVLSTVVGSHSQLIHALFAVAQFLCVLDEA